MITHSSLLQNYRYCIALVYKTFIICWLWVDCRLSLYFVVYKYLYRVCEARHEIYSSFRSKNLYSIYGLGSLYIYKSTSTFKIVNSTAHTIYTLHIIYLYSILYIQWVKQLASYQAIFIYIVQLQWYRKRRDIARDIHLYIYRIYMHCINVLTLRRCFCLFLYFLEIQRPWHWPIWYHESWRT